MTPEDVLTHAPKILTDEQRHFYFENGYLLVENAIPQEWVQRLLDTTDQMVEQSRSLTQSDAIFDLEPGHTAETPRLRRLSTPGEEGACFFPVSTQFAGGTPGQSRHY